MGGEREGSGDGEGEGRGRGEMERETDLLHGCLVPGSIDCEVRHEERETTGKSLGAGEAAVGRPGQRREPHVEVSKVLSSFGPQHLKQDSDHYSHYNTDGNRDICLFGCISYH